MNILVSACLLGINCRYDGNNCLNNKVIKLKEKYNLIPICPEQLGGLTTPRSPSEIVNDKLCSIKGDDVTEQYQKGAIEALKIAKLFNCEYAILKEKSPSCGVNYIYDGTFTGKIINGKGNTTKYLESNGIKVLSENEIDLLLK